MDRVIIETPDRKRFSIDRELVAERWPGARIVSWEDGRPYAGPQPSADVVEDEADAATGEAPVAEETPVVGFNGWGGVIRASEPEANEPDGDPVRSGRPPKRVAGDHPAAPGGGAEAPQEDR